MVDLPAPERPVNHSTQGFWPLRARARLVHIQRLPMDIIRTAQRILNQTRANRLVGEPIDEDKAAGLAVLSVGIEWNLPVDPDVAYANLV
jgi:hypothetical protein